MAIGVRSTLTSVSLFFCFPGFDGDRCEINIDNCLTIVIFQDLMAISVRSTLTSVSLLLFSRIWWRSVWDQHWRVSHYCYFPGFDGDRCEINIDECLTNTCPPGSTCIDGVHSFTCKCEPGKIGAECSKGTLTKVEVYHTITIWIQWQGTATTCCSLPYDHDLNTVTRYSHHLLYFTIRSRSEYSDKVQPPPAVVYHTITIWIQWQGTATTCCSLPYDHDLNTVTRYSHHLLYFTIRSRSEYSDKVQPPPAVVYHTITIWIQWQGTATTCCTLPYDHDLNTVTRYSHHLL